MKQLIILAIFTICSSASAQQVIGDEMTFSCNNCGLDEFVESIENNFGVRFSYPATSLRLQRVSINDSFDSIEEVLQFLETKQIEYVYHEKDILLRQEVSSAELADEHLVLKGQVSLKGESSYLEYAAVYIENTTIGTYSNRNGIFELEIPNSHRSQYLVIDYVGLQPERYKIEDLDTKPIVVQLSKGTPRLEEIIIKDKEGLVKAAISGQAIKIDNKLLQGITSSLSGTDLNRQLQMLPGIYAADDSNTEIKIRGGNTDETQIVMDGMPIYYNNHYYGVFGVFNVDYFNQVDVYKNLSPIQYDCKISGLVDIKRDAKDTADHKLKLNANLLTTGVVLSTKLSDGLSLDFAGRRTHHNVSNSQFNTIGERSSGELLVQSLASNVSNLNSSPEFRFYDTNAKLRYDFRTAHSIELNYFRSHDQLSNIYSSTIREDKDKSLRLTANNDESWGSSALGINYNFYPSDNFSASLSAYNSFFQQNQNIDLSIRKVKMLSSGGNETPEDRNFETDQDNELQDSGMQADFRLDYGNFKFSLGSSFKIYDISFEFLENKSIAFAGSDDPFEWNTYGQVSWQIADGFTAGLGIKQLYYSGMDAYYMSPRGFLNYMFSSGIYLKGAWTKTQQFIRKLYYEYQGETNSMWIYAGDQSIPVLSSDNYMIGGGYSGRLWSLDIELYRKDINGALEFAAINPAKPNEENEAQQYQLFVGEGLSQGMDVMFSLNYRKYQGQLAYTLSEVVHRYKEIDRNNYLPTEDDRRHQLKFINSISLSDWSFGSNIVFTSGRPYTDVRRIGKNDNISDQSKDTRFRYLPNYYRLDLSIARSFSYKSSQHSISLGVFNTLNRNNVEYVQNVVSTFTNSDDLPFNSVIGNEADLLARTINISWRIDF